MATTTARYWYCSGGTVLDFTNVTMVDGACGSEVTYSDSYCNYRTRRKTLSFTLSKPVPYALLVRYQYTYTQYTDYTLTYTGTQQGSVSIPAGRTTYSVTIDCQEERWCNFSGDDGTERLPSAF